MKAERNFSFTWLFIVVLIIVAALPFLIWQLGEGLPVRITISSPSGQEDALRNDQLMWPFRYRKATAEINPGPGAASNALCLLSSGVSSGAPDPQALAAVDMVKNAAFNSGMFVCDSFPMGESAHVLFKSSIEKLLQIEQTGWSVRYERTGTAVLVLQNEDGERFELDGKTYFSGKAPSVRLNGRSASVYSWMPVYAPAGNTRTVAAIDLHLTEQGKSLFIEKGLPPEIPLILENDGPLLHSAFFTVDFSHSPVKTGTFRVAGKLLYESIIALFSSGSEDSLYWRVYVPWIDGLVMKEPTGGAAEQPSGVGMHFSTDARGFLASENGAQKQPFFIKGVNLGTALPGTWSTQFPQDEHLYYRWFTQMKDMHLNTLRVYTLLPPAFYRAFKKYNEDNSGDPLYLIEEIWPEEHPADGNFLGDEYNRSYREEIMLTVDALHGNRSISPRTGRAWGEYASDVSPWLIAYLVGREMEPDEVIETNSLNPDYIYNGKFISAPRGPAVESWLASSCDAAVEYESATYGETRPVGIVSWPILDVLHHQSEWDDPLLNGKAPMNDKAVVDINRLEIEDPDFGGLFGAYHIYPNYPDFMNNQASYSAYSDGQGTFRYGGYLQDFMRMHTRYPALIAEYGISTSAATAHLNPDGYNHGGLSEKAQAEGIIRMTDAIRKEGYAGAMIFEWIDEWAKKTWTTEPFMIPYDRQALWHNVLDPEQNYGITAMKAASELGRVVCSDHAPDLLLEIWGSESHLYLQLTGPVLNEGIEKILFGFDTYDHDAGIRTFPDVAAPPAPTGMEALAVIKPAAGLVKILTSEDYSISTLSFRSTSLPGREFVAEKFLVNRAYRSENGKYFPPAYTDLGNLKSGPLNEADYSFSEDSGGFTLRIPWGLLNVSDPSEGTVLDDPRKYSALPERDVIGTAQSSGIAVYGVVQIAGKDEPILVPSDFTDTGKRLVYSWTRWDVPAYTEEAKKSVKQLSGYFSGF